MPNTLLVVAEGKTYLSESPIDLELPLMERPFQKREAGGQTTKGP
jgi:hypothetical protein